MSLAGNMSVSKFKRLLKNQRRREMKMVAEPQEGETRAERMKKRVREERAQVRKYKRWLKNQRRREMKLVSEPQEGETRAEKKEEVPEPKQAPAMELKRKYELLDSESSIECPLKQAMELKRKYELLDSESSIECPLCFELLSPPVYQCENGHIACSACQEKLRTKECPYCRSKKTAHSRCLAVEKILDSLVTSCRYSSEGCTEMVKVANREEHENDLCEYRRSVPPIRRSATRGQNMQAQRPPAPNDSIQTRITAEMLKSWVRSDLPPDASEVLNSICRSLYRWIKQDMLADDAFVALLGHMLSSMRQQ